jgi:photosystem II stability/assembly factor-like uncharacterized protein
VTKLAIMFHEKAALSIFLALTALAHAALVGASDDSAFDALAFRSIGPAVMGGRIDDVAVDESRPWVLYVGTASGGLWKSENMGTTWRPLFDGEETSSIGDVAVSPSDPDILWVGTGEPNNRQSSTFGAGVYKSEDGGASFTRLGLEESGHIGKVIVHPRDPSRVWVAALGPLWAAGGERGVYRTLDGGKSWERVLHVDDDTGVVTLAIDSLNPDVLYAAAYQRRRTPWGFAGGGPGSGLYKSTNGGAAWRKLEEGLPPGPLGRIGLSVFRSDPRLVYAIVEHSEDGGVYRSRNRGESWEKVSSFNPRPMYYSKIFVDPTDGDRVYVLGSSFHYSDDGGRTFVENERMSPTYDVGVHGDHHTLWIDPENSRHLVLGGDGGLYFSWDRGTTWDKVNNLPIAQFYAAAVDMEEPYNVYGGAQDTHSWFGPSATRNHIGIVNSDWVQINFGDGMYQQVDPHDSRTVYTESQGGNVVRLDRRTGDRKSIKPYPKEGEDPYRFHWTSPLVVSRHDSKVIYLGGNRLFASSDRGDTWSASPDLTWNEDRDELPIMGAVPDENTLSPHDGVEHWGTITTIAESPLDPGVLWVGTDDGRIQLSRDGGESFTSVEANLRGFDPKRATVSRIVASSASPGRAYVSYDRHQLGDLAPYLFVTDDFGGSFRALGAGLPARGWVNVVREHPRNPDLLFVGTEVGLFVSFDRGARFASFRSNLPTVPVDDLLVHPRENDLVVATHGRSFYVLDDATALERHRPGGDSVELSPPRKATLFLPWKHESYGAQRQFVGENPPFGALITYHLGRAVAGVSIAVSDPAGRRIRSLTGASGEGFQRVVWDLRSEPPEGVPRARGPLVPPGRYRLELVAGDSRRESFVDVVADARVDLEEGELQERYEFLVRANELRARLERAVARGESLAKQIRALGDVLPEAVVSKLEPEMESAVAAIEEARAPLGGGRASFRDPSLSARVTSLFSEIDGGGVQQGSLHRPTSTQRLRLGSLEKRAEEALAHFEDVVSRALSELNTRLETIGPLRISD